MLNPPGVVNALLLIALFALVGYLGSVAIGALVGVALVVVAQFRP